MGPGALCKTPVVFYQTAAGRPMVLDWLTGLPANDHRYRAGRVLAVAQQPQRPVIGLGAEGRR